MAELQMGMVESKFADIIWRTAPVTSSQLVKLGEAEMGWKRTTVHTVLRRLCDKGLFQNDGGLVTVRMSREEFYARQSQAASMWMTASTVRCRRLSRPLPRAGD